MKKMAATNITNLRQYALNSEEQIRKRYQDLLMQKYGMGNFDVNKAYTEQTGQALSGWTDTDEKRAAIEYERYLNDIQQAQNCRKLLINYINKALAHKQVYNKTKNLCKSILATNYEQRVWRTVA